MTPAFHLHIRNSSLAVLYGSLLMLLPCIQTQARILEVGAGKALTLPSQAEAVAQDGDTILIDAGDYADAARWRASNLTIRGVGGYAHVRDRTYGGKAIWVIQGANTVVEWIEFSGASVPDRNGAGIRQEAANLTVRHCFFHDNEDGILAGDNAESRIIVEHCEFARNGYGDGYSHNIYINHIANFTIRYCYMHDAVVGHNIKSRAHETFILYNRIGEDASGRTSRDIDLPNGGFALILGNVIHHGPQTENSNLLGFGQEGLINPRRSLFVASNTFVTSRGAGGFITLPATGTDSLYVVNNIFAGQAAPVSGSAAEYRYDGNYDSKVIDDAGFVNAANFDFHLLSTSPAIDGGVDPGEVAGVSLMPVLAYLHPADAEPRLVFSVLDVGAYEFRPPTSTGPAVIDQTISLRILSMYPNPATRGTHLAFELERHSRVHIALFSLIGELLYSAAPVDGVPGRQETYLPLRQLRTGTYVCRITAGTQSAVQVLRVIP